MPMERSRICGTIVNIYHNGITFVALNQRPRELPIDNYKRTQDTYDWLGLMRDSGKKLVFGGYGGRYEEGRTIGCSFDFRNCPAIASGCRG